jgi:hypothetical protein
MPPKNIVKSVAMIRAVLNFVCRSKLYKESIVVKMVIEGKSVRVIICERASLSLKVQKKMSVIECQVRALVDRLRVALLYF